MGAFHLFLKEVQQEMRQGSGLAFLGDGSSLASFYTNPQYFANIYQDLQ